VQIKGQPGISIILAADSIQEGVEQQDYPGLERISLESNPEDLVEALEAGLSQASAELVAYLGPGEGLLPGALFALAEALSPQSGAVAAYAAYDRLDEGGVAVETVVPEELDFAEMLRLQYHPQGPAPVLRREAALEALSTAFPPMSSRELSFWLKIARLGTLRRLDSPFAARRIRAECKCGGGGLNAARERIRLLDLLIEGDEVEGVDVRSLGRNGFISAAAEIAAPSDGPLERFFFVDRFAREQAEPAALDADADLAVLEARLANMKQRLTRQRAAVGVLKAALESRQAELAGGASAMRGGSLRRLAGRVRRGSHGA
jgi:hypothetical protein